MKAEAAAAQQCKAVRSRLIASSSKSTAGSSRKSAVASFKSTGEGSLKGKHRMAAVTEGAVDEGDTLPDSEQCGCCVAQGKSLSPPCMNMPNDVFSFGRHSLSSKGQG